MLMDCNELNCNSKFEETFHGANTNNYQIIHVFPSGLKDELCRPSAPFTTFMLLINTCSSKDLKWMLLANTSK
jgi:hypothetical protein